MGVADLGLPRDAFAACLAQELSLYRSNMSSFLIFDPILGRMLLSGVLLVTDPPPPYTPQ
jgi:hypothetical protein